MATTFSRGRLTWLAYLLLAFYGYYLNIIGPITPFLKEELNLSYTISSLHYTAFALGILLVGLGGHWVIGRTGRWRSLWIGALGMSASALLLIAGKGPWVTIAASFSMGLVGSLILVIVPSLLSDQHGEFRSVAISEANVIASLVATAAPLFVGLTATLAGGWRLSLALIAFVPILLRLGFGKVVPPAVLAQSRSLPDEQPDNRSLPFLFWIYWGALVLAVSIEFCMISWSADYLENSLGMLKANAAQAVSLFLGGMILGRLAGSRLIQRFSASLVVTTSILLSSAGFLIFWTASSVLLGEVGLFFTGLGVANLYPLILSLAIGSAGPNTVQASARATLASGTAILTLPLGLGRLADVVGIRQAYGVVILLLTGVLFMIWLTGRLSQARQPVT